MKKQIILPALALLSASSLSSCVTTSLSDPTGSSHRSDLDVNDFTGSSLNPTEADIRKASGRVGSLAVSGSRFLLVQSGALVPDAELVKVFQRYGTPVPWTGRQDAEATNSSASRRIRYTASQQGCSHAIVVFGEIQKDGRSLPVVSWLPVASDLLPNRYSGMRLHTQAAILEARTPGLLLVSAEPQETRGLEMEWTGLGSELGRSLELKAKAYPELAGKCFR
jgi:hypothetical protein